MLEGSEDDGLVLDGVDDEALAGLDEAGADVVDGGDGDDEAVLARARPLHLREELLLHRVHQLRPEVARRQHDLVVQADVEEHGGDALDSFNSFEFFLADDSNPLFVVSHFKKIVLLF